MILVDTSVWIELFRESTDLDFEDAIDLDRSSHACLLSRRSSRALLTSARTTLPARRCWPFR